MSTREAYLEAVNVDENVAMWTIICRTTVLEEHLLYEHFVRIWDFWPLRIAFYVQFRSLLEVLELLCCFETLHQVKTEETEHTAFNPNYWLNTWKTQENAETIYL